MFTSVSLNGQNKRNTITTFRRVIFCSPRELQAGVGDCRFSGEGLKQPRIYLTCCHFKLGTKIIPLISSILC